MIKIADTIQIVIVCLGSLAGQKFFTLLSIAFAGGCFGFTTVVINMVVGHI
jgi:hypothetical protein